MLKAENVKKLTLEKRQAMLTCLALLVNADDRVSEKENDEVIFQISHILNLSSSEMEGAKMSPSELTRIITLMNEGEILMLGVLMGRVAGSDGNLDQKEINTIKGILKLAKINPEIINYIVKTIELK